MKKHPSIIAHLVLSTAAFVILVIVYFYIHKGVNDQIARTNVALVEVANQQYKKDNQKSIVDSLHSVGVGKEKIGSSFVQEDQVVGFIEKVESIGDITGKPISISAINADDISGAAVGTVGKIKAHVSSSGSWPTVMKTLTLAEKLPYSVLINNLRFDLSGISEATGKSLATAQWRIDFDIEVLSKK